MQKHRKKVLMAGISLGLAAALALGGSLAYFTDREAVTSEGTAGSLDITVENKTDLTAENAGGQNLLNPGDRKPVGWVVSEKGNKSADIRTTITLTSDIPMTTTENPAEFEIYNADDVEEKKDEKNNSLGFAPKAGAEPLTEREISTDGKTITYKPAEYSLNGDTMSGVDAEEDIKDAGNSKESKYVLLFKQGATNAFQKANVTLNVLLEAKQHRNTQGKWGDIAKETYSINGKDTLVVPDNTEEAPESAQYYFTGLNSLVGASLTLTNEKEKKYNTFTLSDYDGDGTDYLTKSLRPGTYTGSYVMTDDFGASTGKTATVSVEIKDGVTKYDLSDQTTLPDTLTNDAGGTMNIHNLTVNVKENPEGKVWIQAEGRQHRLSGDGVSDPKVLSRTFRVIANKSGSPIRVGLNMEWDSTYSYDGNDQWQSVDLSDGDKTVTFNGPFTKLSKVTITADSAFADKEYPVGYFSNDGSFQTTLNCWFNSDGDQATASFNGKNGTYKLVDETNKKLYVFTVNGDTSVDLSKITPINAALTLNNTDSIASDTRIDFTIQSADGKWTLPWNFTLDDLKENNSTLMLWVSAFYDESTQKFNSNYKGVITYIPSSGTATTKDVDLANRTIDFAQ